MAMQVVIWLLTPLVLIDACMRHLIECAECWL